ncbi:MAG: flagellar protein [Lachnospiraceae bacterium]|nr:flagellar protein [Lachnospiraceae bacterium]
MNKIANQFTSIEQVTGQYLNQRNPEKLQNQGFSFEQILNQKREASESSELKFSKHAAMRLENRNISLSEEQSIRLENGVQKASEKGIKESLVLIDSLAFIVNVPNKTVVTAMDQGESSDNIFTNIDGAVIM